MSHWAEVKEVDGQLVVQRVLVGKNTGDEGESFMNSLGGRWVKTSYNGSIRKNFAGPGFIYNEDKDFFHAPRQYESWTLNEETATWEPPIEYPNDEKLYSWDESTLSWKEVVLEQPTE